MNQNLILFLLFSLVGLILIGCLLLNQDSMPNVWKRGIYGGFVCSGLAATGLYVPRYIPTPCIIFAVGMVWMLGHVLLHYYTRPLLATATAAQIEDRNEQRHNTLKALAFGFVVLLGFSVILAFTQGQQDNNRVQSSFTDAIQRLADEVKTLGVRISKVESDVTDLKSGQKQSAVGDSIARKQNFKNQEQLLKKR